MLPGHGASSGRSLVSSEAQCWEFGETDRNPDAGSDLYPFPSSHSNGRAYSYPHGGGNAYRGTHAGTDRGADSYGRASSDGQSDAGAYEHGYTVSDAEACGADERTDKGTDEYGYSGPHKGTHERTDKGTDEYAYQRSDTDAGGNRESDYHVGCG